MPLNENCSGERRTFVEQCSDCKRIQAFIFIADPSRPEERRKICPSHFGQLFRTAEAVAQSAQSESPLQQEQHQHRQKYRFADHQRTGLMPTLASSRRRVLTPSAATAATRHQRETSEPNVATDRERDRGCSARPARRTRPRSPAAAVDAPCRQPSASGNTSAVSAITGSSIATRSSLTNVATSPVSCGHAVPGADHLRDIVDGCAEENPGEPGIKTERLRKHRIGDHCQRRQRRNPQHREQRRPLLERMIGQRSRDGQRGGSAADRGCAAAQQSKARAETQQPRHDDRDRNRRCDDSSTSSDRLPAERGDLGQRDPQAKQRDADTKHRTRDELDAGNTGTLCATESSSHAEQQRQQHHRRAVVLRQQRRRRRKHCSKPAIPGKATRRMARASPSSCSTNVGIGPFILRPQAAPEGRAAGDRRRRRRLGSLSAAFSSLRAARRMRARRRCTQTASA